MQPLFFFKNINVVWLSSKTTVFKFFTVKNLFDLRRYFANSWPNSVVLEKTINLGSMHQLQKKIILDPKIVKLV